MVIKNVKLILVMVFMLVSFSASAWDIELEGTIGDYPIEVNLNVSRDARGRVKIEGRYAYLTTLRRQGRYAKESWLYMKSVDGTHHAFTIYDYTGKKVENWYNIKSNNYRGIYQLDGKVRNAKGKVYDMEASCLESDIYDVLEILPPYDIEY